MDPREFTSRSCKSSPLIDKSSGFRVRRVPSKSESFWGHVRTLPDDSDPQLREHQSKRDLRRLIGCLEAPVILSRGAGAKR